MAIDVGFLLSLDSDGRGFSIISSSSLSRCGCAGDEGNTVDEEAWSDAWMSKGIADGLGVSTALSVLKLDGGTGTDAGSSITNDG